MKIINNPNQKDWSTLLKRPTQAFENIEITVNQIFEEVKQKGDFAISKYTAMFDEVILESFVLTEN